MRKASLLALLLSLVAGAVHSIEDSGPLAAIDRARWELTNLVLGACDPGIVDKAEDAAAKLETAARELTKQPPDEVAAAGVVVGAMADVEAMVEGNCFAAPIGVALMDDLTAVSRSLAGRRLAAAVRWGGKPDEIEEARRALARGDALRARGRRGDLRAFEDAANAYKDALSKALGARS